MKKRLLSILCVLALCLTMLPVTALAADAPATEVTVGGVELDCTNNTVYAITDDTGVVTIEGATADNWNIQFASGVLTLKNATIKVPADFNSYRGIYCESGSLQIILEGSSTIQGSETGNDNRGIYSQNTLTIEGTGENDSLAFRGLNTYGIQSDGGCTIQNVTLTSSGSTVDSSWVYRFVECTGEVKISDSELQVNGANVVFSTEGTANVTNSTITLTGQNSNAYSTASMWANGNLTLTDTTVEMDSLYVSSSAVKSASGDVTLDGRTSITIGKTLHDSMSYAVYAAKALTIPNNAQVTVSTGLNDGLYAGGNLTIGAADVTVSTTRTALRSGAGSIHIGGTAYENTELQEFAGVKITGGELSETAKAYDIWVGGVRVTDANAANVLGDGTVCYDAADNTLTLSGANITGGSKNDIAEFCGICANSDLNLKLEGENHVTLNDSADSTVHGVYVNGDLTISGGSLTVTISSDKEYSRGIYVYGVLTITDGTVIAKAKDQGQAVYIYSGVIVDGLEYQVEEGAKEFRVENGVVSGAHRKTADRLYVGGVDMLADDAVAPAGVSYDKATNTLTLNGAEITGAYTDLYNRTSGIYAEGPLTINLIGTNTVKSAGEGGALDLGIFTEGNLTVTGTGSLTAQGSQGGR